MALLVDTPRTKDPASLLRPPETQNLKLSTPREVTLAKATWERLDTGNTLRAIKVAHARVIPAPIIAQPRSRVEANERQHGPPDLARLRMALSYLDPDCEEQKWKFYLAAMARAAREYPDLAEALGNLAIEWSRGDLWHKPSEKWREFGRQYDDR